MSRNRIHGYYAVIALFIFSVFFIFTGSYVTSASTGFSISALQGNIVHGELTISKGDKVNLVISSGGRAVNSGVFFKSSRKKVATVSKTGVIKAKKKGSAVITVKYNGSFYRIKVKVKTSKITMYNASTGFNLTLNKADMRPSRFPLMVKYNNKKKVVPSKVSFSTSNASVATVDRNGTVTLKATGTVTIEAKYKRKTGKCTIHVTKTGSSITGYNASLTLSPSSGTGTSFSNGSSSSVSDYVKETKQKYSYKLEFVNLTELYTGYECVLHVITDNPCTYVDDSVGHGEDAGITYYVDGTTNYGYEGSKVYRTWKAAFDDIKYAGGYNKVSDGYMVSFIFQEPGYHTIEIKENYSRSKDYSINGLVYSYDVDTNAKISFNVLDAAASEDKFYKRMLREHKGENDRKTLENLEEYFQKNLKYLSFYVNSSGRKQLRLLANYGPWWVTFKDVTCYITTDIMINFANRLGYPAKDFNPGLRGMDHRVAWVYFDPTKVNVPGFDESYMGAYDACPVGTNNNYTYETFKYLYT